MQNQELINDFLSYIEYEKRYSSHTLHAYQKDLEQFLEFIDNDSLIEITSSDLRSWIVYLMDFGLSSISVKRKISTLKSFYKYLRRKKEVVKDPTKLLTIPKAPKKLPVFLEEKQTESLLNNIDFKDDFEGLRDKLIMELFYGTGIRLSELINLKTKDVDVSKKTIKVLGKRNKERLIPVSEVLLNCINEYNSAKTLQKFKNNTDTLILTNKGLKLYPTFVYRKVNQYIKIVSTAKKKSPHILRHTFATHLLNNGADINAVKELLGHSSLAATQIYTHNSIEKLKKVYKQAHPKSEN